MRAVVHRLSRSRHAAWLTLVTGLALTAALGWELHREAVELDRLRMIRRCAEIRSQLDARLEKSEMLLQNLRDFLMLSGESRNHVFARWCYENGLTINCPWLYGIVVATNPAPVEWRHLLPASPADWGEAEMLKLQELAQASPVTLRIALRSDLTNIFRFRDDYSLASPAMGSTPLSSAIRGSRISMSGREKVMSSARGEDLYGTLYYVGVYRPETLDILPSADGEKATRFRRHYTRWLDLAALIVAPVDFSALVRSVEEGSSRDVAIELFSSTNQTPATWLNMSPGTPKAADPAFRPYLSERQWWPMYGIRFTIYFYTTPLFEAQSPRRLAWVAVGAGTTVSVLAAALVGIALRSRLRLERMNHQIREAREALMAAQEARASFSRDLHDGAIQSLYAIQLGLGHTVDQIEANPGRAGRELSVVQRELAAVIGEIRRFITDDEPNRETVDFAVVLQSIVERAQPGSRARITCHCEPVANDSLTAEQSVQLANIAREALSNSLRHGKPSTIQVSLRAASGCLVLEIQDDGAGFDSAGARGAGVGLASMQSRSEAIGGTLAIEASPGRGTLIRVTIPVAPGTLDA